MSDPGNGAIGRAQSRALPELVVTTIQVAASHAGPRRAADFERQGTNGGVRVNRLRVGLADMGDAVAVGWIAAIRHPKTAQDVGAALNPPLSRIAVVEKASFEKERGIGTASLAAFL